MLDLLLNCSYNINVQYEWDEAKRQQTLIKRSIDFADAERFQWDTANIVVDNRRDYKESRLAAIGFIDGRLHVMAFTMRGDIVRIISLRRANKREERNYEKTLD